MVIYQFRKHPTKFNFVELTVPAMFGCRQRKTNSTHLSLEVMNYDK